MERQLLEIQDAFGAFVDDADLQRQDAERRIEDTEHRLRTIERQKQELEDQLREAARQLRILRKSPAVRIARFFQPVESVAISAETNSVTAGIAPLTKGG